MATTSQKYLPGVKPGRYSFLKKLSIFLMLILSSYKNRLQNRNTIYMITVFVMVIIFLQQTILAGVLMEYADYVFNTGQLNHFINFLIAIVFSIWLLPQMISRFRLYPWLNMSRYGHLPLSKSVFVLAAAFLGLMGIGAMLITGIVFLFLYESGPIKAGHVILLLICLSSFFIISTWLSYIIDCLVLFRSWGMSSILITLAITLLFIGLHLYASIPGNPGHQIYHYIPSGLAARAVISILKDDQLLTVELILFMLFYVFLSFCIFSHLLSYMCRLPHPGISKSIISSCRYGKFFNGLIHIIDHFLSEKSVSLLLLIAKDMYYFTKSKKLQVWYMMQFIFAAVIINFSLETDQNFMRITANGTCLLGLFNIGLFMNLFAYENNTVQNYFIFPIKPSTVFLAKNAANLVINSFVFLLMAIGLCILNARQMDTIKLLSLFFIFVYANLFAQIFGNIISIYYPLKVSFNQMIGLFNPFPSLFMMILCILVIMTPIIFISFLTEQDGLYLFLALACLAITIAIYFAHKRWITGLFVKNRTTLIKELNSQ